MHEQTVARNYAEALMALAQKADNLDGFGTMLRDVAATVRQNPVLRRFLESPRVAAGEKNELLARALGDRTPRLFLRFLQALVNNRRQMLIPDISGEYDNLLDEAANRVHAEVTVAREPGNAERERIVGELSRVLGRTVVAHLSVDPAIMGGVVVRVGDTVMDGSVRRRLARLAQRMRYSA